MESNYTQLSDDYELTTKTTNENRARFIGIPMFGIQESIKHFDVKPTEVQLATLSVIPFSEEELWEVKDTHILVATLPLSIDPLEKISFLFEVDSIIYVIQ